VPNFKCRVVRFAARAWSVFSQHGPVPSSGVAGFDVSGWFWTHPMAGFGCTVSHAGRPRILPPERSALRPIGVRND
jgi:hypothetical protein